jgi:hypothetical protein
MSTTREVAERIAEEQVHNVNYGAEEWHALGNRELLISAIDQALQAERERAAKIAESGQYVRMVGGSTGDAWGTAKAIAAAIREGKPQE